MALTRAPAQAAENMSLNYFAKTKSQSKIANQPEETPTTSTSSQCESSPKSALVSAATSEGEENINDCEPQAKRAHVEHESLDVAHYVRSSATISDSDKYQLLTNRFQTGVCCRFPTEFFQHHWL